MESHLIPTSFQCTGESSSQTKLNAGLPALQLGTLFVVYLLLICIFMIEPAAVQRLEDLE